MFIKDKILLEIFKQIGFIIGKKRQIKMYPSLQQLFLILFKPKDSSLPTILVQVLIMNK